MVRVTHGSTIRWIRPVPFQLFHQQLNSVVAVEGDEQQKSEQSIRRDNDSPFIDDLPKATNSLATSEGEHQLVFLNILYAASEYDELPIRHNEENYNEALSAKVPYVVDKNRLDDPHVKTNFLFQVSKDPEHF
ncbi:DExH-box ATP-dependent RNA helicase DExH14 isoform X2 [Tanacetum coccineum]